MGPIHVCQVRYNVLIIATMTAFIQDLSTDDGVHAWTYNYSTSPKRTWDSARQWCQEHFTDMVAIQNQEEIAFLNDMLPFNPGYYWIGIRKVAGVWTWVGTNRSLTQEAENWATREPNNMYEDCVEIYIKRNIDTAKWNDELCRKKKGAVCYTASCSEGSCSIHADCVETIGSYRCRCHPGFKDPGCEEAVLCKDIVDPEQGYLRCYHSFGLFRFNTSCQFQCDRGYRLEGHARLRCQANGHWDHPAPVCQVEQCPALNQTSDGLVLNCSHPIALFSFNSTCEFTCDEGYKLIGPNHVQCEHTGKWTAGVPTCSVIECTPMSPPAMGNMTCVDSLGPFSFGSWCSFTCLEGYSLAGNSTLACLATGRWHEYKPTCTAVQCNALFAPTHGSLSCTDPHGAFSLGSCCVLTCKEGFLPSGKADTECTSLGSWSNEVAQCLVVQCNSLKAPLHASFDCQDPIEKYSYGSTCKSTCEEGFFLNGTADTVCTSAGMWSREIPKCLAVKCNALFAPTRGSLSCTDPHGAFSLGSRCVLTCKEGFLPSGKADTECTSLGSWSNEVPQCLARPCPLLAEAPQHGWMNCSHPYSAFSHSSRCDFRCNEGSWLKGTSTIYCNESGYWNQDLPTCQAVQCKALTALSSPLLVNCTHPRGNFSFGSQCRFACEESYSLNGTEELLCSANGRWNSALPTCIVVGMPSRTARLLYLGVGSASFIALLIFIIILSVLVARQFQKRGIVNLQRTTWEERENPAFES